MPIGQLEQIGDVPDRRGCGSGDRGTLPIPASDVRTPGANAPAAIDGEGHERSVMASLRL